MRNRSHGFGLCIAAAVAAVVIAVPAASANTNFRSVPDPRGDTDCGHTSELPHKPCSDARRRNADIVGATAIHDGALLKFTIRVVGKPQIGQVDINTDAGPQCEFTVSIGRGFGHNVRYCKSAVLEGRVTGPARIGVHRHSVEFTFSESSIGNPQKYSWDAVAAAGTRQATAIDRVPNGTGYITGPLG